MIKIAANDAPTIFAKTSRRSARLVTVNAFCAISIAIPKKRENANEKSTDFLSAWFNALLLKNKKQSVVNIK
jgi:hypothetical protein